MTVALTTAEMPLHDHVARALDIDSAPDGFQPGPNRLLSKSSPLNLYGPASNPRPMYPDAASTSGGGQGHPNDQPSLTLRHCIAFTHVPPPTEEGPDDVRG
jgi:microcystin-dependent protein